mmetsp:Transcript_29467/g.58447  ORF Transcript_29467/g.58447 Transcript_29467/m.58447 type:complete len:209 (-) Transcript_29467:377-1003(-)
MQLSLRTACSATWLISPDSTRSCRPVPWGAPSGVPQPQYCQRPHRDVLWGVSLGRNTPQSRHWGGGARGCGVARPSASYADAWCHILRGRELHPLCREEADTRRPQTGEEEKGEDVCPPQRRYGVGKETGARSATARAAPDPIVGRDPLLCAHTHHLLKRAGWKRRRDNLCPRRDTSRHSNSTTEFSLRGSADSSRVAPTPDEGGSVK